VLTKEEKTFLLQLVRKTIIRFFSTGKPLELKPEEVPSKKLVEIGACFVTLYKGSNLRGCIGTLEANRPLVFDVINNSLESAFNDPRFQPLGPGELEKVKISISVLTKPEPFPVKNKEDLLKKLKPNKHGLIIKKGWARATFLPVVWEQLPTKEEFLSHLCMKAGLAEDAWKETKGMEFFVYEAEEFEEE
jgi:AmmeMemoRadiSam system protein A